MERKKLIPLVVAIVLGALAVFMINSHFQQQNAVIQRLISEGRITRVVIATTDIKRGELIRDNMITLVQIATKDKQPGAIESPESLIGKVASTGILQKQQILSSMVEFPEGRMILSEKTPPGKKAYTISIDNISAVGGQIRNGDRIDVIGVMRIPQNIGGKTITQEIILTLFENAKVLDTELAGKGLNSITLALTGDEIKILTFALENGKVKLVLRSPLDTAEEGALKPFTFDTFLQKMYAAMGISPTAPKQAPVQKKGVEIFRGGE